MTKILYQLESYQIMGILFDVHRNLGGGFSEIVYKDALEYEFKKPVFHLKEKKNIW
jgi:GxxExxY protein